MTWLLTFFEKYLHEWQTLLVLKTCIWVQRYLEALSSQNQIFASFEYLCASLYTKNIASISGSLYVWASLNYLAVTHEKFGARVPALSEHLNIILSKSI